MSAKRSGSYAEICATTNIIYRGFNFILYFFTYYLSCCVHKISLFQNVVFYFFSYFIPVKVADICKYSTFSAGLFFFFFFYWMLFQWTNEGWREGWGDDTYGRDKKWNQRFSLKAWREIDHLSVILKRDCEGMYWIKLAQGKVLCRNILIRSNEM